MMAAMVRITLPMMLSVLVACGGAELGDEIQGPTGETGKSDWWFEDDAEGEACYWNWECDSEADLVCRPRYTYDLQVIERKCKPRAVEMESCDEDTDCADGDHRCVTMPYIRACLPVDPGHPECVEDQLWCHGNTLKECIMGRYREHDCSTDDGKVCRDNVEMFDLYLSACVHP